MSENISADVFPLKFYPPKFLGVNVITVYISPLIMITSFQVIIITLEEHGFILNKGEFRDAVSLRYNKKLRGLPSKCPCGQNYNETRALKGGFVIIRHNNVRDFEANLMKKVYSDLQSRK